MKSISTLQDELILLIKNATRKELELYYKLIMAVKEV